MSAPAPFQSRLLLLWGLFLGAALVAGFAVHRLYRTAQQEVDAQAARAVEQARMRAEERIRTFVDDARRSIMTELAGFHEDGLAATLRRWDAANEIVTATFRWDAKRGFTVDAPAPILTTDDDLAGLWGEFRAWRTNHPNLLNRDPVKTGRFQVMAVRTLDNPALPAATLRYQAENLDLVADAKQVVDPWAGWAAGDGAPRDEWIFWYQAGPVAPVRGCLVNSGPLRQALLAEIAGGETANVSMQPGTGLAEAGFPGYRLAVEPGKIFFQKSVEARLNALIAAALLGLFLLGGAALTIYSRREARDAGRKITFVTQVSHELRTPLTSIRMFADLLTAPDVTDEKRLKFAGTIAAESSRLSALIERLLAFNALEQAPKPVSRAPVAVDAVVREVVDEMKPTLDDAGLRPALELPAAPVMALGDRSILKQALLNLVENACKYARGSGPLAIAVAPVGAHVALRVADRGPGIPAEVRDRLFEPFVQGGGTLTTKSPGVGLGLSLARGLLRQTGATLELRPAAAGATFEILLPAAPANPDSRP